MQEIESICEPNYNYRKFTYEEFYQLVLKLAAELTCANIEYNDRIVINLPHYLGIETVACWFAINALGAVAVIFKTEMTTLEEERQILHVEPKLIINESTFKNFVLSKSNSKVNFYHSQLKDIATIVYTSGTGGRPKGVMVTHQTYILAGEAFPYWLNLNESDRLYTCLSLAHINAQAYSIMGTVAVGATLIIGSKFHEGLNFWKKIIACEATEINMLGAMLRKLTDTEICPPYLEEKNHNVRIIANGEAIASPEFHQQLEQRFGAKIIVSYGSTENLFGFVMPINDGEKKGSNCIGLKKLHPRLPEYNFLKATIDEMGRWITKTGESGELILNNPATTPGYWRDPELTTRKIKNGWYYTGDLISYDEEGYAQYIGRKDKDIIRFNGNLISLREIASVLEEHPSIREVVVVSKEVDGLLIKITFIVLKKDLSATEEELRIFCKEKISAYKIPELFVFVDHLPYNESGRVQKDNLKLPT